MSNEERKALMPGMFDAQFRKLANIFVDGFKSRFGFEPNQRFFKIFIGRIVNSDIPLARSYEKDRVLTIMESFLNEIEADFKSTK
jgi:hypothetical protein